MLWWQAQKPQALNAWGFCTSKGDTMAGRTTSRGYGAAHQKLRRRAKAELEQMGRVPCVRCGMPVYAAQPYRPPQPHVVACKSPTCPGTCWSTWHLDHTDDRLGYLGHAHGACNESAPGSGGIVTARKPAISRSW